MKLCLILCNPRLLPTRLLWPSISPGKNMGEGCHDLLQGISPTQGPNLCLLHVSPELQADSTHWATSEACILVRGPQIHWVCQEGSAQGLNGRHLSPSSTAGILTKTTSKKNKTDQHTHTHIGGWGLCKGAVKFLFLYHFAYRWGICSGNLKTNDLYVFMVFMEGVTAAGLFPGWGVPWEAKCRPGWAG